MINDNGKYAKLGSGDAAPGNHRLLTKKINRKYIGKAQLLHWKGVWGTMIEVEPKNKTTEI